MKKLLLILGIVSLISCQNETEKTITDKADYDKYLGVENSSYAKSLEAKDFWSKRLDKDTTGVGELGKLSGAYTGIFETTGDVANLHNVAQLAKRGMQISAHNKDGFARILAHNYISQHRFKEAKEVLDSSYAGVSNKHETELILFDVNMELGNYEEAKKYLEKVKDNKDYHYLIRLAKWSDHRGDLDSAIKYIEQAKGIAESGGADGLKVWAYSNLGDYYGHAGRVDEAYNMYLKTLEIQPDNAYAKKGIAWILYSKENNTAEANRILDSVMKNHKAPDYYLIKSQMAAFNGDTAESETLKNKYISLVENPAYGNMYNAYLITLYADGNKSEKALAMASKEVENRPTPQAYHLLAYAQLKAGMDKEALKTIQEHVEGKTSEPMALYHTALVYKANGMVEEVEPIKKVLLGAQFEIGPLLTQDVKVL